jgi:formylglycine-generating enzyme required for sulfatase activity
MKGHLVTIGSSEENAVVQSLAAGQSTWIGITDEGHEGRWEWITGEPVQFSDWSPGEPNSLGGTEHWGCLNSERGLKWNDFGTTFSAAFVCEWEPADAALPVLTLPLGAGVTMDTVYIRPGNFVMGGTEAPRYSSQRDERPAHTVTITKGFHIGKFEVTRAQFEAFAKATGYKTEAERAGKTTGVANGAVVSIPGAHWADLVSYKQANDHPVTCVSWNDAKAFCDWMSAATGRVVSLPTEAEWEHAHRAGSRTRWHFGDNEPATGEYAWYNGNSDWRTHPVGAKKPNAWGLFDTHGNVSEWCQDWAGPYGGDAQDPSGPPAGEFRIMRGGSLYNAPLDMVSAFRDAQPPSGHANNTGFRVVVR